MARTTKPKPQVLVILGTGDAPTSVIATGLDDALAANVGEIAIAWHGVDAPIMDVYELLADRTDRPVFVYTDVVKRLPDVVKQLSEDLIESDDVCMDILVDSAERAAELDAELVVLLLWDDEDADTMEKIVYKAHKLGARILDFGNGLVPIEVDEEEDKKSAPVVKESVVEVEEDEEEAPAPAPELQEEKPFTRAELEAMPLAAIKRMVKSQGHTVPMHANKRQLIDTLIGDGAEPTVADVQEMLDSQPEVATPVVAREAFAIVLYTNGASVTINVTESNRKAIAALLSL